MATPACRALASSKARSCLTLSGPLVFNTYSSESSHSCVSAGSTSCVWLGGPTGAMYGPRPIELGCDDVTSGSAWVSDIRQSLADLDLIGVGDGYGNHSASK